VPPQLAYISFDSVPAPKGASTHIEAFTQALGARFGRVSLVTISGGFAPAAPLERWPGVVHHELPAVGPSLIDRVLCFRRFLSHWLDSARPRGVQFRSIFEGYPLLALADRPALIFEVNGLPSVELKYRYPAAADDRELMRKLAAQERACLLAADKIVTPSGVTARFLAETRGVEPARICVIPNGVDTGVFTPAQSTNGHGEPRLMYFGTLASWQGIDFAVRALEQIRSVAPLRLTIAGAGTAAQREALSGLAEKLRISASVEVIGPLNRPELAAMVRSSFAVLAPLPANERNVRQGCCPLKVLEAMACGVPVIASDLEVVRELGEHRTHLLAVKPGSVASIVEAVLELCRDRELRATLSRNAREHIEANHTWRRAGDQLAAVYEELGITRSSTA
jgi:glycosyltransferase involved in cell wall biosynthesis